MAELKKRPSKILKDKDMNPLNLEKNYRHYDYEMRDLLRRIEVLESARTDHETRITALE